MTIAALVLVGATLLPQEPVAASLQIDGAMAGVRVRTADGEVHRRKGHSVLLPDVPVGAATLHFGAGADGKPTSLTLPVTVGAALRVGVASGAAADPGRLAQWEAADGGGPAPRWEHKDDGIVCAAAALTSVLLGGPAMADGRLVAEVKRSVGSLGLCARWNGNDGYWVEWDGSTVTLRRRIGGHELVLGQAPAAGGDSHELSLQCAGFRLEVWFDDAPLIQVMDGAHTGGGWGVWAGAGGAGAFQGVRADQAAMPLPVLAVSQDAEGTAVTAVVPSAPGGAYALCLWLDQPFGPVLGGVGREPFLVVRAGAPCFLVGGTRGLRGFFGDLDGQGRLQAGWNGYGGAALRGYGAQLGGFVLNAEGSEVTGLLPRVGVRL